jgi:hypothetical protein
VETVTVRDRGRRETVGIVGVSGYRGGIVDGATG